MGPRKPEKGAPIRTCVGCGRPAPKESLMRLALLRGRVVLDQDKILPGRGAYLHPGRECLQRLLQMKNRGRVFKRPLQANAWEGLAGPGEGK